MIRAGLIGAAGYTGGETLRLLLNHPHVDRQHIVAVSSSHAGKPLASAHPDLWGYTSLSYAGEIGSFDKFYVILLFMGHGKNRAWMAKHYVPQQFKVNDISIDFRAL
ncbi:MAG: N-acetyl-gamma-glutamyl-phosphate reductase, partial [Ignavibacteria bacterium]